MELPGAMVPLLNTLPTMRALPPSVPAVNTLAVEPFR